MTLSSPTARRPSPDPASRPGLDDSADLLAELVRETGLDWHQEQCGCR
ncbi:hypothetical protein NMG29_38980 [Streptomyces cocklensis]|nr:hypothetical protein [Actinacidiphila cocklensis]MDD1064078.1 hypothetical protein [Actinacidiphila cocklensis]